MTCFGLKQGQDSETQAAHPHQEFEFGFDSRREALIRIALLQKQTLNEKRNRILKCLKGNYSTVKVLQLVDGGRGHLPSFFLWGFDNSSVPASREFAIQGQKNGNAQG